MLHFIKIISTDIETIEENVLDHLPSQRTPDKLKKKLNLKILLKWNLHSMQINIEDLWKMLQTPKYVEQSGESD